MRYPRTLPMMFFVAVVGATAGWKGSRIVDAQDAELRQWAGTSLYRSVLDIGDAVCNIENRTLDPGNRKLCTHPAGAGTRMVAGFTGPKAGGYVPPPPPPIIDGLKAHIDSIHH